MNDSAKPGDTFGNFMAVRAPVTDTCEGCMFAAASRECLDAPPCGDGDVIYVPTPHAKPVPESQGPTAEKDPTGRDQHAPGAKVDAGKAEYDMVLYSFPDALALVDRVGKFGAQKYTKGGFLEVPEGQRRYLNAEVRHIIKRLRGEEIDPDSQEMHLAHQAWNALAQLQLFIEGKGT